jgi:hypothetical protein
VNRPASRSVLLALLLTGLVSLAAAQPAPVEPRQSQPLDPRFGVAESLAAPTAMADIGAGWTRVLLPWHHIQPAGPDDWRGFGRVLREPVLDAEVARGVRVAAVLQYTPPWAASDPAQGHRAVPRNLYLPFDDPENYWGKFVYETVRRYAGRIDDWIIWNEPDILLADGGVGESYTWTGTEEDFAQLLKVGYLAAKRADPRALVAFPATSFLPDATRLRPQYYARVLDVLARDPVAVEHNFFHDAVALNMYYRPDALYRVHGDFKAIQQLHGLDRPVWLTETNAMPRDDRAVACSERHVGQAWQPTQNEQAAFAVQAYAMAVAAGYERIGWWRLVDGNPCVQPELWGLLREDRSWRPAAEALRTVVSYFSGFYNAQFVPLEREVPSSADVLEANWRVHQVALDRAGGQRVRVVWNGDSAPLTVQLTRTGSIAYAVDMFGQSYPVGSDESGWLIRLPAANALFSGDPPGYHYIGGWPIILVENEVDPASRVLPPVAVR